MSRLWRKHVIPERYTEFSPILFDVLFGLLMFLGIDGLFSLRGAGPILFSVASLAIVLHWWLKYKAADEMYGAGAGHSVADLVFGLVEIVLLQLAMTAAGAGDVLLAVFYFSLPLLTESAWALIWRFCSNWKRTSRERLRFMEQQLEYTLFLNLGAAAALGALIVNAQVLSKGNFIGAFAVIYALYAVLTSYFELIDLKAV